MHRYIEACAQHPSTRRLASVLDAIVPRPRLHARFLNTLARLEYVGVRKMLKARRAERLDVDGLQHMLDESVHALRLKKAALAVAAAGGGDVATFGPEHTLAGDAAESYFQAVDHAAESTLRDIRPEHRGELNFLLTSAAIEIRAQVFYPTYDDRLRAHRAGFSVASISKDESRHLAEMSTGLDRSLADWRRRLEPALAAEATLFGAFLDALEQAAAGAQVNDRVTPMLVRSTI